MPTVDTTLTTFVEFIASTSTSKITRIKDAKDFVSDNTDFVLKSFYLPMKTAVISAFRANGDKAAIRKAGASASDKKADAYTECANGLLKWMGRKRFAWTGVTSVPWTFPDLTVNVNPELGMLVNGKPYAIKLHFKTDPLHKGAINPALHLMQLAYPNLNVGILDVRRGKLLEPTVAVPHIDALLAGEAASFATMWVSM